jgi:hypothetical protein
MRYIDKRKLTAIINSSYFGKLFNLPIDKIDIIVLKLWKARKRVVIFCV